MPHPYRLIRRRRVTGRDGTEAASVELLANGRGFRVDVWTPECQRNGGHWRPLVRKLAEDLAEAEAIFAAQVESQEWRAPR